MRPKTLGMAIVLALALVAWLGLSGCAASIYPKCSDLSANKEMGCLSGETPTIGEEIFTLLMIFSPLIPR